MILWIELENMSSYCPLPQFSVVFRNTSIFFTFSFLLIIFTMKMEWKHMQTNCCQGYRSESGELSSTQGRMILIAAMQMFKKKMQRLTLKLKDSFFNVNMLGLYIFFTYSFQLS